MKNLKIKLSLLLSLGIFTSWAQVTTFNYTGAIATYTVPADVTRPETFIEELPKMLVLT